MFRRRRLPLSLPVPEVMRGLPCMNQLYEPQPPFQVQFLHESGNPAMIQLRSCWTLREAVVLFFELGWPQLPGWIGAILDSTRRRVLVWNATDEVLSKFGPTGGWWATDSVFALMDELQVATPVDRAIWETMSKELRW